MRSQPGGNRFVRPGGAGVGPGAIRAETGGDYVSGIITRHHDSRTCRTVTCKSHTAFVTEPYTLSSAII